MLIVMTTPIKLNVQRRLMFSNSLAIEWHWFIQILYSYLGLGLYDHNNNKMDGEIIIFTYIKNWWISFYLEFTKNVKNYRSTYTRTYHVDKQLFFGMKYFTTSIYRLWTGFKVSFNISLYFFQMSIYIVSSFFKLLWQALSKNKQFGKLSGISILISTYIS